MGKMKDLTGMHFGELTVVGISQKKGKNGDIFWKCFRTALVPCLEKKKKKNICSIFVIIIEEGDVVNAINWTTKTQPHLINNRTL